MEITVAIQMDPLESINIDEDSTFVLALEAQKRGYTLFHYLPASLSLKQERVIARAQRMRLRREKGNYHDLEAPQLIDLRRDIDLVLMRQDPPFDMSYITSTYLLEMIQPETLVVNAPGSVRDAPEKLFMMNFPTLIPPTLISRDEEEIRHFRADYGDVIIKPLYGNGGAGIFLLKKQDANFSSLLEMFFAASREPVIVQAYLPDVRQGDKRIVLVDGEPVGAVNRLPRAEETRSNLHAGGKPEKTTLTSKEETICQTIGPELKKRGLIFAGIDVIGGYLTEINVTSPTCLQEINRFNHTCLESGIWDVLDRLMAEK